MLRGGLSHKVTYYGLGVVQVLAGTGATLFSAALKAGDPASIQKTHPVIGSVLIWAQTNALEWLFWLIVAAGLASGLKRYVGAPWVWNLIEKILVEFRKYVFKDEPEDSEEHHHRVTLFKHVRLAFGWPLCWGWLVPVARSAHTTRWWIATFRAPDNPAKAEGVAGRTWAKKKALVVSGLPSLRVDSPVEEYQRYGVATSVTEGWLRKRLTRKPDRPLARSYGGCPVLVGGNPWGVIVLDSQDENGVTKEKYQRSNEYYDMLASFLGLLLERTR